MLWIQQSHSISYRYHPPIARHHRRRHRHPTRGHDGWGSGVGNRRLRRLQKISEWDRKPIGKNINIPATCRDLP